MSAIFVNSWLVIELFAEAGGWKQWTFRPHFCYRDTPCYCKFIIDTTSALAQKDKSVTSLR